MKSGCVHSTRPLFERRREKVRTASDLLSEDARKSVQNCSRQSARVGLARGRRGCAGDSACAATHSRTNRGAGCAPDRKRHDTPDCRADAGTRHSAFHGASAGIGMPMPILIIISPVIGRVGDPVNMLVAPVGVVPIGIVVGDRPVWAIGIHPMHPPACAVRIARDIGTFGSLGAGYRGSHHGCAHNSEQGTQSECSVKPSHVSPLFEASHIRQISASDLTRRDEDGSGHGYASRGQ